MSNTIRNGINTQWTNQPAEARVQSEIENAKKTIERATAQGLLTGAELTEIGLSVAEVKQAQADFQNSGLNDAKLKAVQDKLNQLQGTIDTLSFNTAQDYQKRHAHAVSLLDRIPESKRPAFQAQIDALVKEANTAQYTGGYPISPQETDFVQRANALVGQISENGGIGRLISNANGARSLIEAAVSAGRLTPEQGLDLRTRLDAAAAPLTSPSPLTRDEMKAVSSSVFKLMAEVQGAQKDGQNPMLTQLAALEDEGRKAFESGVLSPSEVKALTAELAAVRAESIKPNADQLKLQGMAQRLKNHLYFATQHNETDPRKKIKDLRDRTFNEYMMGTISAQELDEIREKLDLATSELDMSVRLSEPRAQELMGRLDQTAERLFELANNEAKGMRQTLRTRAQLGADGFKFVIPA